MQRLRGEGPPRSGNKGNGDLHYRFVIDIPSTLTPEQAAAVDQLAAATKTNPREKLFKDAGINPDAGSDDRSRAEEMA